MTTANTLIAPHAVGRDELPAGDLRVLVYAPRGRDADVVTATLDLAGISCDVCDDPAQLSEAVGHIGALVLTVEALTPTTLARLNKAFDAQPSWSSTPVIFLLRPHLWGLEGNPREEAMRLGSHTIVLDLPVIPTTLVSAARCALESRRRQYQVRDLQAGLEATVARRTARLRATALELTRAEHEERRRLAHLLHDHLQQLMVAAKMHLSLLKIRDGDLGNRQVMETVKDLLDQSITASRSLATDLSPPVLGREGLGEALRWLGAEMLTRHRLNVTVKAEDGLKTSDPEATAFLFEATRELLFNIVKHAGVDEATIALRGVGDEVQIIVEDHGAGLPTDCDTVRSSHGGVGFGLSSIRERLESVGGRMESGAPRGGGCTITICVPAYTNGMKRQVQAVERQGKRARSATIRVCS